MSVYFLFNETKNIVEVNSEGVLYHGCWIVVCDAGLAADSAFGVRRDKV